MIVSVMANRIVKQNKTIFEVFTVSPNNRYTQDESRFIYHYIAMIRGKLAIHNLGFQLIDIHYNKDNVVYEYLFNENIKVKNLNEVIRIDYKFTSKKCKFCQNNKNGFCIYRGKKIEKNMWYKCLWWTEINYRMRHEWQNNI